MPPCLIRLEYTQPSSSPPPTALEDPSFLHHSATLLSHRSFIDGDRVLVELHLEHDTPLNYLPGDALALHCPNPPDLVASLLSRLQITDPDQILRVLPADSQGSQALKDTVPSHLCAPFTVRQGFLHLLDISQPPRKVFLQMLSQHASDPSERGHLARLASRSGAEEHDAFMRQHAPTLPTLLALFPSCNPPLHLLVNHLPPLLPRHYSVCSSPLVSQTKTRIVVGISRLPAQSSSDAPRYGVASRYVLDLIEGRAGQRLAVTLRRSTRFVLSPEVQHGPLLLVAAGTGITPFLAFLEDRRARLQQGESVRDCFLYYGCQNKTQSSWFDEELRTYLESGALTGLYYAFSREPTEKKQYVQDRIEENQATIAPLLVEHSGYCFVCGAHQMTSGLADTLNKILSLHANPIDVKTLTENGKYLLDVW